MPDMSVIAFAAEFGGMDLNSPNDLVIRSDQMVYWTDPPYGIDPMTSEQGFNGLFRRSLVMGLTSVEYQFDLLADRPNGIALSPDETLLYVADTNNATVYVFDVDPAGPLSNRRVFVAPVPGPDGVCTDVDGNVFVTSPNSVNVYGPNGNMWGQIMIPGTPVANCVHGGPNRTTLYIATMRALMSVELTIPGTGS
jgi:gluconolactonase